MKTSIIKLHNKLQAQRIFEHNMLFVVKYFSYFIVVVFGLFAIYLGVIFTDIVVNSKINIIQTIEIITAIILFNDAVLKLILLKPKLDNIYPYLTLPISKKSIIKDYIIINMFNIKHYLSLFCVVTLSILLYNKEIISIIFLLKYIIISFSFIILNSILSICIKNNSYNIFIFIFIYIVYFLGLFYIIKCNILYSITTNIIISILLLITSCMLFIISLYKFTLNYIYYENNI